MAWTFTDSPQTVPRDAVRLYIGDTEASEPLMSDATVDWLLATSGNSVLLAAARAARLLMPVFARMVDQAAGDHREYRSQQFKAFTTLTEQLEGQAGIGGGGAVGIGIGGAIASPVVTGVSRAEMESVAQNPDRPGPAAPLFPDLDSLSDRGVYLYDPG